MAVFDAFNIVSYEQQTVIFWNATDLIRNAYTS